MTQPDRNSNSLELLNAHGPYDHALWDRPGDANGKLACQENRTTPHHKLSNYLVDLISTTLTRRYSLTELNEMSLLDIGCYDGWIAVQLQNKFSFKSALGVEPRVKNIQKGLFAREFYKINTDVEIVQADITSLDYVLQRKYDVVLCLNVLHHVDSTPNSIKLITKFCNDLLILSSVVIEKPKRGSSRIKQLLNLKDIQYLNTREEWSTAAFKFETPYFDGSTSETPIVNLPEKRLIEMSLKSYGFKVEPSTLDEETKVKTFFKARGEKCTFIIASKKDVDQETQDIYLKDRQAYESTFLFTEVSIHYFISRLNQKSLTVIPIHTPSRINIGNKLIFQASKSPKTLTSRIIFYFSNLTPNQKIIVRNISNSPIDKTQFELGKYALRTQNFNGAKITFKNITNKRGCDWRAFYRFCYFLAVIAYLEHDLSSSNHYKHLLNIANPNFPIKIQEGVNWVLKKY